MEGLKWNHNPDRIIGTAKVNEDGSITCTIDKVSNNENRKLKYPRKRTIVVNARRGDPKSEYVDIINFASKYKRGPNSKVVIKRYAESSIRFGVRITIMSVTFYSYEPVGILRENCINAIKEADIHGTFSIDGYLFNR